MAIESIKFGKDEFRVKSILAFYDIKDNNGYHISAHTTMGTRLVCESSSKAKIEEKMQAISGQLKMVGLENFAYVGGVIVNMDEVKHIDFETTPWLASTLEKQVVATFKNETKLAIGDVISTPTEYEAAREVIEDYDRQKTAYRNSAQSVDLNETLSEPQAQAAPAEQGK